MKALPLLAAAVLMTGQAHAFDLDGTYRCELKARDAKVWVSLTFEEDLLQAFDISSAVKAAGGWYTCGIASTDKAASLQRMGSGSGLIATLVYNEQCIVDVVRYRGELLLLEDTRKGTCSMAGACGMNGSIPDVAMDIRTRACSFVSNAPLPRSPSPEP